MAITALSAKELEYIKSVYADYDGEELSQAQQESLNKFRKDQEIKNNAKLSALVSEIFGNLSSSEDKFEVVKAKILNAETAKGIKPKTSPVFGRVNLSTDEPEKKSIENGKYKDYSSDNLPWRVGFSHLLDSDGNEVVWAKQIARYGVSFNKPTKNAANKLYGHYSRLRAGDMVMFEVTTDSRDGYKHYSDFTSFKRMITGGDAVSPELELEIKQLWDDNKVSKTTNGRVTERVVMYAPKREAEYDLNSSNFSVPRMMTAEEVVKNERRMNVLSEARKVGENKVLSKALLAQINEMAKEIIEQAKEFGETVSRAEAMREARETILFQQQMLK